MRGVPGRERIWGLMGWGRLLLFFPMPSCAPTAYAALLSLRDAMTRQRIMDRSSPATPPLLTTDAVNANGLEPRDRSGPNGMASSGMRRIQRMNSDPRAIGAAQGPTLSITEAGLT